MTPLEEFIESLAEDIKEYLESEAEDFHGNLSEVCGENFDEERLDNLLDNRFMVIKDKAKSALKARLVQFEEAKRDFEDSEATDDWLQADWEEQRGCS